MRFTERKIAAKLKEGGYKLTPQRRMVIRAIASSESHLSPDEIYGKVQQERPGIGRVTIYRTLDILGQLGLICRMHTEGRCRSYLMRRPPEHHHHLVCSSCGKVVDFTSCDLSEVQQNLSRGTGFIIHSHLLEFTGLCQACQETG